MNKSAAVYPLWKGFERFKWPLRAPLEGRHQEVKWADGLLHIDGAVTKSWFNGFGTLTLCCIREPIGEQLCLGGWVGGGRLQRPSLYPLLRYQGCHRGSRARHRRRGCCRVVLLKLIRHATPAWPTGEYSVLHAAVCVCIMCHQKDERP